jgi:hypothetical protein
MKGHANGNIFEMDITKDVLEKEDLAYIRLESTEMSSMLVFSSSRKDTQVLC